ncbi:hypothetical protein SCARD494_10159 [Seiridium cardinale]
MMVSWNSKTARQECASKLLSRQVLRLELRLPWNLRSEIGDILKSFPNKFVLRHSLKYIANPGRIFRYWPGGPVTSLMFAVHQWTKRSCAVYWIGSHKIPSPSSPRLDSKHGPLDPLNVGSEELLRKAGCTTGEFCLPEGGM